MSDAVSGPPADDQAAPTVWWSPTHNALVGKHKYDECFDLIEQDDMGWRDTEELSALPADAVRLVPAPAVAVPAETRDPEWVVDETSVEWAVELAPGLTKPQMTGYKTAQGAVDSARSWRIAHPGGEPVVVSRTVQHRVTAWQPADSEGTS